MNRLVYEANRGSTRNPTQLIGMHSRVPRLPALSLQLRFVLAACIASFSCIVQAHHSFARFDDTKTYVLAGTLKAFEWTNPHSWIILTRVEQDGSTVEWRLEGPSLAILRNMGWKPTSLRIGDKLAVTIHPVRNGSYEGAFLAVKLPDGSQLAAMDQVTLEQLNPQARVDVPPGTSSPNK
jgi:hypothetical protein